MAEEQNLASEDIRKLLKQFGVKTEQAVIEYLNNHPEAGPLSLRLVVEDLTDYGEFQPTDKLRLNVEGEIRR